MITPVLSSQFFEKHKPGPALYEKWRSLYSWHDKCLPIYEWQGVLFVGCMQPPEDFPPLGRGSDKVVFVLCDHESLKKVWYSFEGTVVAPRPRKISAAIPSEENSDLFNSLTGTVASSPEEIPEPEVVVAEETVEPLAGLDLDLGAMMEQESEAPPEAEAALPITSEEDEMGQLEGLDLNLGAAAAPSLTPLESADPFAALEVKAQPSKTEVVKVNLRAPAKPTAPLVDAAAAALKIDPAINEVFKEMSYHFKKSMVLLVAGDSVKPWKWNESFKSQLKDQAESHSNFTLSTPSPFRIVASTQKPYHGYVVPNELNDKFFEEWNGSQTPDHMTLTPIVIDDQVIGMVLGLGDKNADNKNSLSLAEKVAADLAQNFKKDPNVLAA